jgi:uncharacterized protein
MESERIIQETENFIRAKFGGEGSGHDWFHVDRVRKMALRIGKTEGCDLFLTEMAALLHDLDDWKLNGSDEHSLSGTIRFLEKTGIEETYTGKILQIIEDVSFKGAGVETPVRSVEAAVVQDADRLDAIGAIGIARTFAFGGHKNRPIYDPEVEPVMHQSFGQYKSSEAPTINHFYEKLLLLKDRMNTSAAKDIAEERHRFMQIFLARFYDEWDAKC